MAPTPILPDPRELAPIEDAIHQARAGRGVLDAGLSRLLAVAFSNGPLAEQRLAHLVRRHGLEVTVAVLEDRHFSIPRLYVGFLRGSLFKPGERRQAQAAVAELVPMIGQRAQLTAKLTDLERARRDLLERADQTRIQGLAPERPRTRPHQRRRSDF